jgi:hypothetical protein
MGGGFCMNIKAKGINNGLFGRTNEMGEGNTRNGSTEYVYVYNKIIIQLILTEGGKG